MKNDRAVQVCMSTYVPLWLKLPECALTALAWVRGRHGLLPNTTNFLVAAAKHSNDRISFSTFQFCTSKLRIRLTVNKSSTCPVWICLQINFCPFFRSSLSTFILIYVERWECTKFLAPRRACIGCENACLHWNLTHVMWSAAWSQSNYISRKRTVRQA